MITDIVILNYNDSETCLRLLNKIRGYEAIAHIIVVDNCSCDDSYSRLSKEADSKKIFVIKSERNGGYAYGNNFGAKYALEHFHCDYLIIANPDVLFEEETVISSIDFLRNHQEITIVAPRMLDVNKKLSASAWNIPSWHAYAKQGISEKRGFYLPKDFDEEYLSCDCLAGSLIFADSKNYERIGMYDENTFLFCEETILGFRNGKGGGAILRDSYFLHQHSASINKSISSVLRKYKILWKSKIYVLKNYYRINWVQNIDVHFLRLISLAKAFIIGFVK